MKSTFITSLLLFVNVFCIIAQDKGQQIASTIENVTVYMTGAQLEHAATASLNNGKQFITLTGLSPELDANSVVVEIEPKSVTILSVSSNSNYLKPVLDNKRIAVVRDSITLLEDKVKMLSQEVQTLQREKDMLFKNEAIGGVTQGVAISEIEKAADFFRNRTNSINQKLFVLEKEVASNSVLVNQMRNQLNELNAKFNPPSSEVVIECIAPKDVNATIKLKYLVTTAGWAPKYDVRANSVSEPVTLVYRANVFNGCGLDWKNVHISLSTATPMLGAEKPVLEKWDVALERNTSSLMKMQDVQVMATMAGVVETKRSDYLKQEDEKEVKLQTIEVQELSTEFAIKEPYTILTDKKPYTVEVTEYQLNALYEYYAAPKVDKDVFLTAKVTGWNQLNLVSGKASVYFAGSYLGQSMINTSSTQDTLTLSLGRDRLTTVTRTQESELNKRQVMGNNTKETFYFKSNIRNNHDKAITVVIEDQVPISTNGDIMVDALELDGGKVDELTGKVTWIFTLQPNESKEFRLGYSIKTPKNINLNTRKFRSVACPSF